MLSRKPYYIREYDKLVKLLRSRTDTEDEAMSRAVGGAYDHEGAFQAKLILAHAPKGPFNLFDLGCGSGRAANALSAEDRLTYYGVDIIPDLIEYARTKATRPDWRFELLSDTNLPADDNWADMILVMSVFTHLKPAEIRDHLAEAARIIKPGGKLILSFLDSDHALHKKQFRPALARWFLRMIGRDVLVTFLKREQLINWVESAGFTLEEIIDYSPVARQHTLIAKRKN